MPLFLVTFITIYASVHIYVLRRIKQAFSLGRAAWPGLALFMLLMICTPMAVRFSERAGYEILARFLAHTGYAWMGIIFVLFTAQLSVDLYRLAIVILGRWISTLSRWRLTSKTAFITPLLLALAINLYGYFEAQNIRLERVVIRIGKLPARHTGLRLAQISDVHLGLQIGQKRLKRIIAEVNRAEPDLLVATGDLVDGQINNLTGLAELLQAVQPRYGKFAVTGNHEYYAGISQSLAFLKAAGFKVLQDEGFTIDQIINIAGVNDKTGVSFGMSQFKDAATLLAGLPADRFTVFLKHRPVIEAETAGHFDLQLSGHTHNGQIFPFNLITRLLFPIRPGLTSLDNGGNIYVSRGTGTWGPMIRFLAPPEVTLFEIVPLGITAGDRL